MKIDNEQEKMAMNLKDDKSLCKLSKENVRAIKAKYHIHCLIAYTNCYRSFQRLIAPDNIQEDNQECIL